MVFPIRWPEPFGLVMVEAMACGTPVVTTNWGAAPELVADGVTGFRRDSEDDLVAAIGRVGELSPAACRARVVDEFSGAAMVRGYEAVYERVVSRT
jgi:glycosyltransferase involved in cell wall biosynthesis